MRTGDYKLFLKFIIDYQCFEKMNYKLFYRKKCVFTPFGIRKKRVFLRAETKNEAK